MLKNVNKRHFTLINTFFTIDDMLKNVNLRHFTLINAFFTLKK